MIVTVFRARLKPGAMAEYTEWAQRLSALAITMPGYVSHKVFTAEDGERVTLVEFETAAALEGWRRHTDHLAAKKKGRADFYADYSVQVCEVKQTSRFPG